MTLSSLKRLLHSIVLNLTSNAFWRADYVRKKGLFGHMGNNVVLQSRYIPFRADLISVGDNTTIASRVLFLTHDAMHRIWHNMDGFDYPEHFGEIHIGNNCFIGAQVILVGPVTIGDDCVVAAGSVVLRDVPAGSVVGGCPARVLGRTADLRAKRRALAEASRG